MDVINYFPAIVLSFLGLFVGVLITYLTLEEKDIIKKYVKLSNFALILTITIVTAIMTGFNIWIGVFFVLMVGFTVYHIEVPSEIIYPLLGLILAFNSINPTLFFTNTFLIFALGITIGTLYVWENRKAGWLKNSVYLFWRNSPFLIIAIILYFFI